MSSLKKIIAFEWSMGNGQCPICQGMGPPFMSWVLSPMLKITKADLGHSADCWLAEILRERGEAPMMKGRV